MNRPHRRPTERLVSLSPEDQAILGASTAQQLVDQADALLFREMRLASETRITRERRQAIEVYLQRSCREKNLESITAADRVDGSSWLWKPHQDGTGFERIRVGPVKPDAGTG